MGRKKKSSKALNLNCVFSLCVSLLTKSFGAFILAYYCEKSLREGLLYNYTGMIVVKTPHYCAMCFVRIHELRFSCEQLVLSPLVGRFFKLVSLYWVITFIRFFINGVSLLLCFLDERAGKCIQKCNQKG